MSRSVPPKVSGGGFRDYPPQTFGGTDLLIHPAFSSSFILYPCPSDAVAAMLFGIVEGQVCADDHVVAGLRLGEGRRTDAERQLKARLARAERLRGGGGGDFFGQGVR